jgi:hypothetical protein
MDNDDCAAFAVEEVSLAGVVPTEHRSRQLLRKVSLISKGRKAKIRIVR